MNNFRSLADIRRDYGDLSLSDDAVSPDPIRQFNTWFAEVLQNETNDPTAMVLSTVDEQGYPDSRMVLLKGLEEGRFIFYTNYHSAKALQIEHNPHAALNFYWPQMARQVRIRGTLEKVSSEVSDNYFSTRPYKSQLSAIISLQSQEIANRAVLEKALDALSAQKNSIKRPQYWGGYRLSPFQIEFWQGRDNRLHDRIQYILENGTWISRRLAP